MQCLDTLLVAGLTRALFENGSGGELIGSLLLLGLVAAGLLAASVQLVLRLGRHHGAQPQPQALVEGQP